MWKPWNWIGLSRNPNVTMEYIDSHPDIRFANGHSGEAGIPWDWDSLSRNKFRKHPFFKGLPKVSDEQKLILEELHRVFDMPPNVSSKMIFQKGGFGFWEGWECCQDISVQDSEQHSSLSMFV